ncbi:hypothetical protein ACTHQF_15090 [Pedobacter sp. SAFR-022]|uniref:hypothetical protein n=1 Tax=Pedobacter sp. SAFR-022 TaxID=3436861 RepID=UPI003F7E9A36
MNFKTNLYSLICLMLLLSSCQQKPKHPQAGLINQSSATALDEQGVIAFAEDIEHGKNNLKKLSSLVYKRGQENFFVEQYFNDHGDQVLIAHEQALPSMAESSKRYYFKNDSLILVTTSAEHIEGNEKSYEESRTYLRNYTVFKRESKVANSAAELNTASFEPVGTGPMEDYKASVERLFDALQQKHEFELVFDKITRFPDASFISLKSVNPNGYTAQVELQDADAFVDSLIRDPGHFRNNRINFNWKVEDMQAIYVPSGSTSTSASGLNR